MTATESTTAPDGGHVEPPPPPTGKKPLMGAPRVFLPAAGLLVVFVALAAIFPDRMSDALSTANTTVVKDLGWFYVAVVTGFVAFSLWAALSPVGDIVLGKDDEEPEFALGSWFAMLFAAGMGIGLVYWGVAEPLNHFNSPPTIVFLKIFKCKR